MTTTFTAGSLVNFLEGLKMGKAAASGRRCAAFLLLSKIRTLTLVSVYVCRSSLAHVHSVRFRPSRFGFNSNSSSPSSLSFTSTSSPSTRRSVAHRALSWISDLTTREDSFEPTHKPTTVTIIALVVTLSFLVLIITILAVFFIRQHRRATKLRKRMGLGKLSVSTKDLEKDFRGKGKRPEGCEIPTPTLSAIEATERFFGPTPRPRSNSLWGGVVGNGVGLSVGGVNAGAVPLSPALGSVSEEPESYESQGSTLTSNVGDNGMKRSTRSNTIWEKISLQTPVVSNPPPAYPGREKWGYA
jgi:hypothetical protein